MSRIQEKGVKASSTAGLYYGISTSIDVNTLVFQLLNFFLYVIMFLITARLIVSTVKQFSTAIR